MSRHSWRRAVLAIVMLVAGVVVGLDGAAVAAEPTGRVVGRLTDNGEPVRDVRVLLQDVNWSHNKDTVTDASGAFRLDDVPPGNYKIGFLLSGSMTQYSHHKLDFGTADVISVAAGVETTVDETLLPHGSLVGRITNSDGSPVNQPYVTATLEGSDSRVFAQTNGDGQGNYSLGFLPVGSYVVAVRPAGFSGPAQFVRQKVNPDDADRITITAGTRTTLDEQLLPMGAIAGRLTDVAGGPVQGAFVQLHGPNGLTGSLSTGADGSYRIVAFPGTYKISYQLPGGLSQWAHQKLTEAEADPITVTAGADQIVNETTIATGAIAGRLTDAGGKPVADARVGVTDGTTSLIGTTDADGAYRVAALPGDYRVSFATSSGTQWARGKSSPGAADPITVSAGQTSVVDEVLAATGSIQVTAVDSSTNAPVAKFCAEIIDVFTSRECTENGTVTFRSVLPGRYTVSAFADDSRYLGTEATGVVVRSGETTSSSVRFTPAAIIRTTIRDAGTGAPVRGACVQIVEPLNPAGLGAGGDCADVDGNVSLSVAPGTYNLFVWARDGVHGHQWVGPNGGTGAQATARVISARPGATVETPPIRLDKAGHITGVITDAATGRPLANAAAGLSSYSDGVGAGEAQVFTDAAGRYTLTNLGPYSWTLFFRHYEYAAQFSGNTPNRFLANGVKVKVGETATHDVGLRRGATLSAKVVGADGRPVEWARITVVNALSGDVMGSGDCSTDRCTVPVFGPQFVKLSYDATINAENFYGFHVDAPDFRHATPVFVPATGTKSVTVVAKRQR